MGTAWLDALILGSVTGQCTRLLHVERNSMTLTPFILYYIYPCRIRTCLLCSVFRIFFSRTPGGPCSSAYTFYFSLTIAKFEVKQANYVPHKADPGIGGSRDEEQQWGQNGEW